MAIDHLAEIDREVGVAVAGERLGTSVADFYRRCLRLIAEERRKPAPDVAVVAALADAVRFTREHCYLVGTYLGEIDAMDLLAGRARSEESE